MMRGDSITSRQAKSQERQVDIARMLIERGMDVPAQNKDRWTLITSRIARRDK